MAWIRLDDDYINHPKFTVLSHGAFRLWHEGMAHCRKLMTDGLIRLADLKTFRYAQKPFVQELVTPRSAGVAPLWMEDADGYRVHDYLDWNPSRGEDQRDREAAKQRMRAFRGRKRVTPSVTPSVTPNVTPSVTPSVTPRVTPHVPGPGPGSVLERESERKPDARSNRPIYRGTRFTVFEWMFDDLCQILGPYSEDFGLDQWFYDLNLKAERLNLVMPKRDGGAWLQAQLLEEATRRGLPVAGAKVADDPYAHFPHAWQCGKCGGVHEGTEAQARGRVCLAVAARVAH